MNMSGFVIVGLGIFIFVVAIRGTQSQVLPFFFSPSGPSAPDKNGKCPTGTVNYNGICIPIPAGVTPTMPDKNGNCPSNMTKAQGLCWPQQ